MTIGIDCVSFIFRIEKSSSFFLPSPGPIAMLVNFLALNLPASNLPSYIKSAFRFLGLSRLSPINVTRPAPNSKAAEAAKSAAPFFSPIIIPA